MANIQISNLPLYTGSAAGVYLVMNNSSETTTYKVTRETLIGSSGTSGTSGNNGSSGTSGTSGATGAAGAAGDKYKVTSSSNVTNSVGAKNISIGTGYAYTPGQTVIIYGDDTHYMYGNITGYALGTLQVNVTQAIGVAITLTNPTVNLSGVFGTSGTSGSSGTGGSSGTSGTSGVAVPAWTSAGTIQSVGWGATTTAPTIGTTLKNNLSYRQVGVKQWEVAMGFDKLSGQGAAAGSGDYLFTLPNGLSFDTTLAWQSPYTASIMSNDVSFAKFTIPSANGLISDGAGYAASNFMPIIWNATQYRILAVIPNSTISCIGSPYYPTTTAVGFTLSFTFTST